VKGLQAKRIKNKKKRKKVKRAIQRLKSQRKRQWVRAGVFFVFCLSFVGAAFYSLYYQSTTLSAKDAEYVVQGYYTLDKLEGELVEAGKSDNPVKAGKNIKVLAGQVASYGNRKATVRNTVEGQKLLNRYYKSMKELGVNISTQADDFFMNEEKMTEFMEDIVIVRENQEKMLKYYNVKESAFKKPQ
jgi:hypothetical protein